MDNNYFNIKGLNDEEVLNSRKQHGYNRLEYKKSNRFIEIVGGMIRDPMVLLLLVAAIIYFISGKTGDGIFLTAAILFQSALSLYQEKRSKNALDKLKEISQPRCKVLRNGECVEIHSDELVLGDFIVVEEGVLINADAKIVHSNDFSVNESILTGESMWVSKTKDSEINIIYRGTTVVGGLAIACVLAIGNKTKLGEIGKSLENIKEEKTPLELKINSFVKIMALIGAVIFVIFWIINYLVFGDLTGSLLKALTLAMSILPEEIPIAFATFMALGAWRMMQTGIVVKQMKTVETLGSATVICTDKTGTITENKMSLVKLFALRSAKITDAEATFNEDEEKLITAAMWASEMIPFDPMEIALHAAYSKIMKSDERLQYTMAHEYPLEGKPPMMTHLFKRTSGELLVAAKGAPEAIMSVCKLSEDEKLKITNAISELTKEGYRILAVSEAAFAGGAFPNKQQDFDFHFVGIVAFYDPPKKNIDKVLQDFYAAGIAVKIITGDNEETTKAIAKQVGFKNFDKQISGEDLMKLSDADLQKTVHDTHLFTRMFPEAKLKIINALKAQNEIVAMTGDGVNDAPALKAAHIGIAMGKKGTEIAKQASSLILLEDDLSKMVIAIAMGRKIYSNLKKAIQYIISIHIPIIFTVFIPLALGWKFPSIFSPIHIIFLELIMGPTCSIIYENEPMEKNAMLQKPRLLSATFFSWKELAVSIVQGLVITIATLSVYVGCVAHQMSEEGTRTMIFCTLVAANIFLTLENRSAYYSCFTTLKYKNNLVGIIILITVAVTALLLLINPLSRFFQFEHLSALQLIISIAAAFVAVFWLEVVKAFKRSK